jgi:hypothetical protein
MRTDARRGTVCRTIVLWMVMPIGPVYHGRKGFEEKKEKKEWKKKNFRRKFPRYMDFEKQREKRENLHVFLLQLSHRHACVGRRSGGGSSSGGDGRGVDEAEWLARIHEALNLTRKTRRGKEGEEEREGRESEREREVCVCVCACVCVSVCACVCVCERV